MGNLAESFNASQHRNRIGALFFSNERWKTIPLNSYFSAAKFEKSLKSYQLMNNLDSLSEQLNLVYNKLLGPQKGSRIDAPKLIFLLTHESALRMVNPDALAESMKPIEKAGIRVVVAAIGKGNDFPYIRTLIKNSSDIFMAPSVSDALNGNFANAVAEKSLDIVGMSSMPFT